jgi:hypothetical protein
MPVAADSARPASKRRVRFFFAAYVLANLGLILYGVSVLWAPDMLLESFSVHVYRFPADASSAVSYLAALFRLLAFFDLVLGIVGLLLLRYLRATRQRWVQRLAMVSTILAYLGPIVFDNTVDQIGVAEIAEHVLFALILLAGFLSWRSFRP